MMKRTYNKLKKYEEQYTSHISPWNNIQFKDKEKTFLQFCHPSIIKKFISEFNDYHFYYFYGAVYNKAIKPRKNNSFNNQLQHDFDSGIYTSFVVLKESQSKIKKNISQIKNNFKTLNQSAKFSLYDLGYVFTVFYSEDKNKIIVSIQGVDVENDVLVLNKRNKFVISITSVSQIKVYKGVWGSFTIGILDRFNYHSGEDSSFELELIAELFKLEGNNEFLANDLIYKAQYKELKAPKLSLKKLRTISSKKSLFLSWYGFYPKLLKTLSYAKGVRLCEELKCVDKNEHPKIINFYKKYPDVSAYDLLTLWYKKNLVNYKNSPFNQIRIEDYVRMNKQLGLCINVKITSLKRLNQEHDRLAREVAFKRTNFVLKVDQKYKELKLPFTLIDTTHDLILEGINQHHCVASYADKINRGDCAIYKGIYQDQHYTIELGFVKNKLCLLQCEGRFRFVPPKEYIAYIKKCCELSTKNENNFPAVPLDTLVNITQVINHINPVFSN